MGNFFAQHTVRGFQLGEVLSALQKSIRRCDERGALCWAVELDQSGHGKMLMNRLLIIASEDVGLAEPTLPANLRALYDNYVDCVARKAKGYPERLFVVHATIMVARAKKSRMVDEAIFASYAIEEPLVAEIPDYALDGHTARGKRMGRSGNYEEYPEPYHVENEPDLGETQFWYRERKRAHRERHGYGSEWVALQGDRGTFQRPDGSGYAGGSSTFVETQQSLI